MTTPNRKRIVHFQRRVEPPVTTGGTLWRDGEPDVLRTKKKRRNGRTLYWNEPKKSGNGHIERELLHQS